MGGAVWVFEEGLDLRPPLEVQRSSFVALLLLWRALGRAISMFFLSVGDESESGGMRMRVGRHADIFIVRRLYAGLKCIRGFLMLISGGDEKTFGDEFISISRMLVCLRYKSVLRGHAVAGDWKSITAFKGGVELDMSTLWWSGGSV